MPANPFVHDIIVVDGEHYHFLEVDWVDDEAIRLGGTPIPRGPRGPIVDAAFAAPHVQGLRTWMRLPNYHVSETPRGYRVTIKDVRYGRLNTTGIGHAVVDLDRALCPRPAN